LKPAPATPLTALLLAELAVQAGIPDGVLSVVTGGDDAGKAISAHPDIRKVSFTGSTSAGKSVMRSGTETLKRVTLELGGSRRALSSPMPTSLQPLARAVPSLEMLDRIAAHEVDTL
jgi:acyl-CoA reductase-like NAD-dependent aldehyde dehydrogenase